MQPIGDDIEDLTVVDARGEVQVCSRTRNAELFSLVVGGYGLFGVIYSATLRLSPRQRVKRMVDVIDLDDAMNAVYRRVEQGCLFGDFQFVIDAARRRISCSEACSPATSRCPRARPRADAAADLATRRLAQAAEARP